MSGEYRGRRDVVEFLRRTGLETSGTYGSKLHTSSRTTIGASPMYRACGHAKRRSTSTSSRRSSSGSRRAAGRKSPRVPLDAAFDAFWA